MSEWQIIQMLISGAVLPLLGLVFWLLKNEITTQNAVMKESQSNHDKRLGALEESFHEHQLDVAKNYAQHSDLAELSLKLVEDMKQIKEQYTALIGKIERLTQYLSEFQIENAKELAKHRGKDNDNA